MGIINYFVTTVLGGPRISWLGNPEIVIPALSITTVWWTFGFPMLVFIAGLHNIPEQLYEAAKIDGAGPLRTFRHITLPLIMPTMLFVVVTQFIAHMQVFAQPYIITAAGRGMDHARPPCTCMRRRGSSSASDTRLQSRWCWRLS